METNNLAEVECQRGSFLAAPIISGGHIIGSLCGGYLETPPEDAARKRIKAAAEFVGVLAERWIFEMELQFLQERYRLLIDGTSSITGILDPEMRMVTRQPSWETYTGQVWEEYRDQGWVQAIHLEDRQRVQSNLAQALAGMRATELEARLWHAASGRHRYSSAYIVPVTNTKGSILEWAGIVVDIEKRKRAEMELQEEKELNSSILASLSANIAVLDEEGENHCRQRGLAPVRARKRGQRIYRCRY